jgi:hypothetical protein
MDDRIKGRLPAPHQLLERLERLQHDTACAPLGHHRIKQAKLARIGWV